MKHPVSQATLYSGDIIDEVNKPVSFYVYKNICELLFIVEGGDYIFSRTFFTLESNLL